MGFRLERGLEVPLTTVCGAVSTASGHSTDLGASVLLGNLLRRESLGDPVEVDAAGRAFRAGLDPLVDAIEAEHVPLQDRAMPGKVQKKRQEEERGGGEGGRGEREMVRQNTSCACAPFHLLAALWIGKDIKSRKGKARTMPSHARPGPPSHPNPARKQCPSMATIRHTQAKGNGLKQDTTFAN